MRFAKWQALGNDYIVLEDDDVPFDLHRRAGPGDLRAALRPALRRDPAALAPADPTTHVAELRIFNPDGSEAELSGNGVREAVLYLRAAGWTDRGHLHDPDGGRRHHADADRARIRPVSTMGRAATTSPDFPGGPEDGRGTIDVGGTEREFQHVSIGNPQCAIEVGERAGGTRSAGDRAGDRVRRDLPQPDQRQLLARRGLPGPSAHLRAGGGGDALVRNRGAPERPSPPIFAERPARSWSSSTAANSRSRSEPISSVRLTGTAEPVFDGTFSDAFVARIEAL